MVLSNELIKVEFIPPWKIWKAKVSSTSSSSGWIQLINLLSLTNGYCLKHQLSKSFTPIVWPLSTGLIKPNFHASLCHQCNATISLKTIFSNCRIFKKINIHSFKVTTTYKFLGAKIKMRLLLSLNLHMRKALLYFEIILNGNLTQR